MGGRSRGGRPDAVGDRDRRDRLQWPILPEPTAGIADLMETVHDDEQYQLWRRPYVTLDVALTDAAAAWMQAIPEFI